MIEATESNKIASNLHEIDKESKVYKKLYKKVDKVISRHIHERAFRGNFSCYVSTGDLREMTFSAFERKRKQEEVVYLKVVIDYIDELESMGYRVEVPIMKADYFYIYWD